MANPYPLETIRRAAATNQAQIASLIATLSRSVDFLTADIEAEEATTGIHDMSESDYSLLARSLRARRENIKGSIDALGALVQRAPKAA
jgi:hypothetical protein